MSLVGSLEDLGLGDILQIISLSRKSGVLFLRCEQGEGRIVFQAGQVQGAFVKGGPADLRALLVQSGALDDAGFEAARHVARTGGASLEEVVMRHPAVGAERLESLRRGAAENAVFEMFRWRAGEFSFEIRDEADAERDAGMLLASGVSAQYLAMEATRLRDEAGVRGGDADEAALVLSGEDDEDPARAARAAREAVDVIAAAAREATEAAAADAAVEPDAEVELELAAADDAWMPATTARAADPGAAAAALPAVVVIDRDLATLEWVKGALRGSFQRVHIFQRTELGIERIRQYLARGEAPIVVVSPRVAPDPWSGARDAGAVVERLKAQAPRTPVLALVEGGAGDEAEAAPPRVDGILEAPRSAAHSNPRLAGELDKAGRRLVEALRAWSGRAGPRRPARDPIGGASPDAARLKAASARLRDPASRGEVLPLVMRFAAETFSRVAIFLLRDDVAVGMAQLGLARAGGPDDDALQRVAIPAAGCGWIRRLCESRAPVQGPPRDAGDVALVRALGARSPSEAYLAPLQSGDRVVAILYADTLPDGGPIGDTSALEVVLHEAGLALDRAVLERALAEARS